MNLKRLNAYVKRNLNAIRKWIKYKKEYKHLNNLFEVAERNQTINKKFVFNTVQKSKSFIDREFFLGKILALNGAKIIMLLDDGLLYIEDLIPKVHIKNLKRLLIIILNESTLKRALKTYKDKNLKVIYYSQILNKNKKNLNDWQKLKKDAEASTSRFFRSSQIDLNNKNVRAYYLLMLKNAVLSQNIGEYILNSIKPDIYFDSHGIYSIYGPAFDFLQKNGVNCMIFMRLHSHTQKPHIFFISTKVQTLSRCRFWKEFNKKPLTEEMKKKVDEIMKLRFSFETKDTKIYYSGKLDTFKVDKNDGYKYHIAIFPNVSWDGNIEERHKIFNGLIDWLVSTIEFLRNRKDIKIYLRFHPSESTLFINSVKVQDIIENYLNLEKINNLVIIPSDKKINTYNFLKSGIDLGIVYDGILGIELPFLKIPVILGAYQGAFTVQNGNFIAENKEEYFNYLRDLEKTINDFHKNYELYYKNVAKYAYWYLVEIPIQFPIVSNKIFVEPDLMLVKKEDIKLNEKFFKIFNS